MTYMTVQALSLLRWARERARLRDDRGLETAEVLLWMGLVAGIIGVLSGVLQDILNGVVDEIRTALNFD
ncbi:MAG TPA: hypothetical protein VK611_29450 [Acidimicrobiales bacterium]|nr:hypothetical protein [Acidimicrobiales bacterium]